MTEETLERNMGKKNLKIDLSQRPFRLMRIGLYLLS